MKCYKHQQSDAVGLCKSCQKGVCPDCLALVDGSVACKDSCEEDVAAINHMMAHSQRVYKNYNKQWRPSIMINGVGGLLFLAYGLYSFTSSLSWFLIGLGSIMIIGAVMIFIHSKHIDKQKT